MKYYKHVDAQAKTTTVECYSFDAGQKDGRIEITKAEYATFIATLPAPTPVRDLAGDFDALVTQLKSKGVID